MLDMISAFEYSRSRNLQCVRGHQDSNNPRLGVGRKSDPALYPVQAEGSNRASMPAPFALEASSGRAQQGVTVELEGVHQTRTLPEGLSGIRGRGSYTGFRSRELYRGELHPGADKKLIPGSGYGYSPALLLQSLPGGERKIRKNPV